MPFDQRSLIHRVAWFPPCFVRQYQPKKKTIFLFGDFRPFPNQNVQIWDHFFPLLFLKDSESKKILHIRLWEVGAKRRLNGTSKVNTWTDRQTDKRPFWLIESIGPEGRCFENICFIRLYSFLEHFWFIEYNTVNQGKLCLQYITTNPMC